MASFQPHDYILSHRSALFQAASSLNVDPLAVAGAISDEAIEYYTNPFQNIYDLAISITPSISSNSIRQYLGNTPDIGVGNLDIDTAEKLLIYYEVSTKNDPLGMQKYYGNNDLMIRDLLSYDSDATVNFASVMALQAQNWLMKNTAPGFFDSLTRNDKAALIVRFYNSGVDSFAKARDKEGGAAVYRPTAGVEGNDFLGRASSILKYLEQPQCFPGSTEISGRTGKRKISKLGLGDWVNSFDVMRGCSKSERELKRVTRIFHNITDVWIKLSNGLTVTPGHHFLDAFGKFRPIADIVASDGQVVLEDGSIAKVTGEYIHYSEATAHLYEQAEGYATPVVGGLALAPVYKKGWKTYNFEVEDYHTYIAGGVRVHNDSIVYSIKPGDTLWSIGNRYDVSVSVLALLNGIRSPDEIYAGNPLQVPDASSLEATQRCQELRTAATDRHPVLAQFRSCGNGHHPRRFSRPAICRLPGTATGDASRRTPAGRRTAGIVAHPEESRERA